MPDIIPLYSQADHCMSPHFNVTPPAPCWSHDHCRHAVNGTDCGSGALYKPHRRVGIPAQHNMVQFTDLPTDIVDQILACLPDFQTLAAAIKVSKEHTYNVFQEHRQTILTSVGLNLVGSSLIHALRVALCQNRFGISVDLNYEESLDAATEFLASLTLGQRRFLESNAVAVQALEDVYSQMYVLVYYSLFSIFNTIY